MRTAYKRTSTLTTASTSPRIELIVIEDRDGQSLLQVDWLAALRPARFEHEGRTFDQARQHEDGTWIYKTVDPPRVASLLKVPVRLERGVARCFVTELDVWPPAPDTLEHEDAIYMRKGMSDGRVLYWHG